LSERDSMETLTFLGLFVFFREVDTYYAPPLGGELNNDAV